MTDKIIVTGGAGFIGSNLVDKCLDLGYDVVIIDDLSSGREQNLNPKAKFFHLDIRSEKLLEVMEKEKADFVFHLAAQSDVQISENDPMFDASVNVLGTLNVLEGCRRSNPRKVIYSSSAAVYGDPIYLPVGENHPLHPKSVYGTNKMLGEFYFPLYQREFGLDYLILRYSNVFGPRQRSDGEGGVVSIFLHNLRNEKPVSIYGDGNQTRDFIFVDDVVNAHVTALQSDTASNRTMNVSTGLQTTVNQLFQIIISALKSNSKPSYAEPQSGEIRYSALDNNLIKKTLDWTPAYTLSEGIQQ